MSGEEITLEDLLADEPVAGAPPTSFRQLLAEGFPRHCGLHGLAVVEQLEDPGPELAAVRLAYLQLLTAQRQRPNRRTPRT